MISSLKIAPEHWKLSRSGHNESDASTPMPVESESDSKTDSNLVVRDFPLSLESEPSNDGELEAGSQAPPLDNLSLRIISQASSLP